MDQHVDIAREEVWLVQSLMDVFGFNAGLQDQNIQAQINLNVALYFQNNRRKKSNTLGVLEGIHVQ